MEYLGTPAVSLNLILSIITGYRRGVNEICAILGLYAAYNGSLLSTFRDNISVPSSRSGFGGLEVAVLAFVTQIRGFKTGRSRRIFQGEKILSTLSFGREVKPMSHVVDLRHVKDP